MRLDLQWEALSGNMLGFPASVGYRCDLGPVRSITHGRRAKPVGRSYSIKNGRAVAWETRNELHALYHAEVSPSVLTWWESRIELHGHDDEQVSARMVGHS